MAKRVLGWAPKLTMQETVDWTADWYKAHQSGRNMRTVTLDQIARYEKLKAEKLARMPMNSFPLCRFCRAPLRATFVDLGSTPLANSYLAAR